MNLSARNVFVGKGVSDNGTSLPDDVLISSILLSAGVEINSHPVLKDLYWYDWSQSFEENLNEILKTKPAYLRMKPPENKSSKPILQSLYEHFYP